MKEKVFDKGNYVSERDLTRLIRYRNARSGTVETFYLKKKKVGKLTHWKKSTFHFVCLEKSKCRQSLKHEYLQ